MADVLVNAVGEQCPIPVVKATQALRAMTEPGTLEVLVDNEIAVQNLTRMGASQGYAVQAEQREENLFSVKVLVNKLPEKEAEALCGWISLYCVEEAYRGQGFGIQLLGQAVSYFRPLGRKKLRLALSGGNGTARRYFADYGFVPEGKTPSGRDILEKDISYHAEFLEETDEDAAFPQVCR